MDKIIENELFVSQKSSSRILGEFLVELSEDRPGILAALTNVFADHGINILYVVINATKLKAYFMVDLTKTLTTPDFIVNELKKFSFVRNVTYRIVRDIPIIVSSCIKYVFNDENVVIINQEILNEITKLCEIEFVREIFFEMGIKDGTYIKSTLVKEHSILIEDLLEIVRLLQLRGFCEIVGVELIENNRLVITLKPSISEELISSYLNGLIQSLYVKYSVNISFTRVDNLSKFQLIFNPI